MRNTDGYIRYIYTEGGCYKLHILLKKMYTNCTILIEDEIPTVERWSFRRNNINL